MDWWNELTQLQQILAYIAIPATLVMIVQLLMSLLGLTHGADADGLDGGGDFGDGSAEIEFDEFSLEDSFAESHDEIFDIHEGALPDDFGADFDTDGIDATDTYDADTSDDHHGQRGAEGLKLFTLRGIIGFFAIGGWVGIVTLEWGIPAPVALSLAFVAGWLALYFVAWSIHIALKLQQSGNIKIDNAIGAIGEVYIPIPPLKSGKGKINVIIQERYTEIDAVTSIERTIKTGEAVTVMGVESEGVLMVVPKDNIP